MQIIPYLLAQNELLATLKLNMRDDQSARWTPKEYYGAVNSALQRWAGRVYVPFLYTIPNGFAVAVYEYSIPWYIREPLTVQIKQTFGQSFDGQAVYINDSTIQTWDGAVAYELEPDGSGGQKLRLGVNPWAQEARIIWWSDNSRMPLTVPTLSASITDTDISLTIASIPNIGPAGYVKIENEWISYAGFTVSGTTTTLTNLTRAINGTTAASHAQGAAVAWGIAALRQDLYQQLEQQCYANLHNLFLTNAAPQETQNHIFQVRYYQQMADEYWRRYVPEPAMQLALSRRGIGALA